jgi:vanillate O-demethylase monooxygenase subunit
MANLKSRPISHHFVVVRNVAQADPAMTQFMHEQLFVAFNEDVTGLAQQEAALDRTPPNDLYEFSVGADGPSVAMRRYLLSRALSTL